MQLFKNLLNTILKYFYQNTNLLNRKPHKQHTTMDKAIRACWNMDFICDPRIVYRLFMCSEYSQVMNLNFFIVTFTLSVKNSLEI